MNLNNKNYKPLMEKLEKMTGNNTRFIDQNNQYCLNFHIT